MKQYLERYLKIQNENKKPNTVKMMKGVLEDFFDFLGDKKVTIEIIEDWVSSKNGNQKTTKKQYVGVIRGYIDWCIDRDYYIGKNPAKIVLKDMGKANDRNADKRKAFTLDEVKKMIKTTLHPRDRVILLTLAKTGCRANELTSIQVQNVDFTNMVIKLTNRKGDQNGNKNTLVPMDGELSENLKNWITIRGKAEDNALFTSYMNKKISTLSIWLIVKAAAERIGIEDGHPHCFRHFFTTILNQNRCNPQIIATLRGDMANDMVQYYSHISFDIIRQEYLRAMPMLLL